MRDKKSRQERVALVIDLIKTHCISSQEELLNMIKEKGFDVTQATLSRDLKLLHTTKVPSGRGTYMYVLPEQQEIVAKTRFAAPEQIAMSHNFQSGFMSLDFSGNLAIVKTRYGYASGIAYDIDVYRASEIIGTISGVDTILIVLAEGVSHERAREILSHMLPIGPKVSQKYSDD